MNNIIRQGRLDIRAVKLLVYPYCDHVFLSRCRQGTIVMSNVGLFRFFSGFSRFASWIPSTFTTFPSATLYVIAYSHSIIPCHLSPQSSLESVGFPNYLCINQGCPTRGTRTTNGTGMLSSGTHSWSSKNNITVNRLNFFYITSAIAKFTQQILLFRSVSLTNIFPSFHAVLLEKYIDTIYFNQPPSRVPEMINKVYLCIFQVKQQQNMEKYWLNPLNEIRESVVWILRLQKLQKKCINCDDIFSWFNCACH